MGEVYGETIAIGRGYPPEWELTREIVYPNLYARTRKKFRRATAKDGPGKEGFAGERRA